MTSPVADVDPVSIAVAELTEAAAVLADYGLPDEAVSGLNEPPYPHLRVAASPGGDSGRLLWSVSGEVVLQAWAHPDGRPGSEALRRLLVAAAEYLCRAADRPHVPGRPVVTDVSTIGSPRESPDPATDQLCWAITLLITAHPDNS